LKNKEMDNEMDNEICVGDQEHIIG